MSASHRRPAQPQDKNQPYHHYEQSQQYAEDPNYAQYASPPFQHQQGYYQPQQYASTNPYAFASHTPVSYNSYPQHVHAQSQPYSSPHGLGYQNATPNAYSHGGYLAANSYAASSHHLVQGSSSSGHSPGSSSGRPRYKNFVLPSQGTSPSIESQVAHLNLTAPTPSLLHEHAAQAAARSARSANGLTTDGEPRSDISLRYPSLPRLPERCVTPPLLQSNSAAETDAAKLDRSVLDYVTSLRSIIDAYEKRDDLLRMRTEAFGFQPKQAWLAWQTESSSGDASATAAEASSTSNPVLGVRLLQRLDKLQRENDELGELLASGARVNSSSSAAEVEELRNEVEDCHELVEAMDKALCEAEARAAASERALEAACRTNSTAMLPAGATQATGLTGSQEDSKASGPVSKTASPARRGSKPAIPNTGGGGKGASQQQQRNVKSNQGNAKPGGTGKSTRNDKSADGKSAKTPQSTRAKK